MADNLLDKASILLTPTAYDNGSMLSIKPEVAFGEELSTNGDFSNGTTGWSNGSSTLSVVDGKLKILATGSFSYARQNIAVVSGKKYKISVNFFYNSLVGNIEVFDGTTNTISEQLSKDGVITLYVTPNSTNLRLTLLNRFGVSGDFNYWDNVSVVEDLSGDFDFSRNSAATRVNAQGLVENVQILSPELVSNGNFSQIGTEEVLNGNFSQEGSELITNGSFDTDSDWSKVNATISGGTGNLNGTGVTSLLFQNILTDGKTYTATFTISDYNGSGSAKIINSNGDTYYTITENGTFTIYFKHIFADGLFYFRAISGAAYSIDNVSVKEVGQNWALGSGWSIGDNEAISDGSANTSLTQSISFNPSILKIKFEVSDLTQGSVRLFVNKPAFTQLLQVSSNGSYETTVSVTSGANNIYFYSTSNFIGSITNISVKEVGQDWTLGTGWSIGDGVVEANNTSSFISQSGLIEASKLYRLTFEARLKSGTNGTINAYIGGSNNQQFTIANTNWQSFTYEDTRGGSAADSIYFNNNGTELELDNISVKEITHDTNIPRINYEGFSYQDSLGSELVVNGDFSVDSDWAKNTNWSISGGTANADGTSSNPIFQNNVVTANKPYKVTFTITDISQGAFYLDLGLSTSGISYSSIGTYTETITSGSGNTRVYFRCSGNTIGSIDNVSVKEVTGQEVVPDSGCGSWLLEPQSTNLITYSEDFSQWTLGSNATLSYESGIVAPDGSLGVYRLTLPAQSSTFLLSNSFTGKNPLASSIYAKSAATNNDFNLFDGSTTSSLKTATSEWQRFDYIGIGSQLGIINQGDTFITDIYIWGAQAEAQSYATSYIPTNGATNTRLKDLANNSGNATLINSTEGVLYAEIAANANEGSFRQLTISDGSGSNRVSIDFTSTDNQIRSFSSSGGGTAANMSASVSNATQFNKVAVKYKLNDYALWINGVEVDTDTSASTPIGLSELAFDNGAGGNDFYGKTKALAVFPILTDAELQSLTTI